MFHLAHLSDIHLGPLPDVTYRELASKRITGYINWHRKRRIELHDLITDGLVADLHARKPDHIAVTGDLVNLALDAEIEMARLWLETVGAGDNVSVVPGNHDAYVPGALDKACRAWGQWMTGDDNQVPSDSRFFPYMRVRGNVALIGVSSARASAPFMAVGYFRNQQAKRLGELLAEAKDRNLFRVIMIHHPPVRNATAMHKRLYGIGLFHQVVARHGVELVLHGHTHLPTIHWHSAGRNPPVPVVGVAAAGQAPGSTRPAACYNLFAIDRKNGRWNIQLSRYGYTGHATDIVKILSKDISVEPVILPE